MLGCSLATLFEHTASIIYIYISSTLQDWDDYGIDWNGPVPSTDPYTNTVVVQEVEELLTEDQKTQLDAEVGPINPSCLVEEILLNHFSAAKRYVLSCVS